MQAYKKTFEEQKKKERFLGILVNVGERTANQIWTFIFFLKFKVAATIF